MILRGERGQRLGQQGHSACLGKVSLHLLSGRMWGPRAEGKESRGVQGLVPVLRASLGIWRLVSDGSLWWSGS